MGVVICAKNSGSEENGHKVSPYLLKGLPIDRPNQVWASDLCYVAMAKGFVYLTVIMDWYSRRVPAWRVSIPYDAEPGLAALAEALMRDGSPEIFNTDQGPNTPGRLSRRYYEARTFKAAWMAKAGGTTMCMFNGYGAA
jgi:putative transposase